MEVLNIYVCGEDFTFRHSKNSQKNVSGKVDEMCRFYGVGVTRYQWKWGGTSRDSFIIYNENTKEINLGIKLILVFGNQIPIKNCPFLHP